MFQRALAVAAAIVLIAGPALAADPGARPAITLTGTVTDVALATDTGTLAIATNDPGSTVSGNADANVWHMYAPDGTNINQRGDVDPAACESTALFDDCSTNAVSIAISANGQRLVSGGTPDNGSAHIFFETDTGNEALRVVTGTLVELAMSDDGRTVVVGTAIPSQAAPTRGRVHLFDWPAGTTAPVLQWTATTTQTLTDIDVSPDGQSITVGAGTEHIRLKRANNSKITDANFGGSVRDVAIASSGLHISVAGSSEGLVLLYNDESSASLPRLLRVPLSTSAVDAVDITPDGTLLAVGNAAGDVWVYRIDPILPKLNADTLVGRLALGAAVSEVALAKDGKSLAIAWGGDVGQYAVEAKALPKLWSTTVTASSGDVAIDGTGSIVAAGSGESVQTFVAKHALKGTVGTMPPIQPGSVVSIPVVYTNTGNRIEDATFTVAAPSGLQASLSKASLRLVPDQAATLHVNVTLPSNAAPGPRTVNVAHATGTTAGSGTTSVRFDVPTVHSWSIQVGGATSLSVPAGGKNAFILNVTNRGNVAEAPVLGVTITEGWGAEIVGFSSVIPAGESRQGSLTVTAPANAPQLAAATATVTVVDGIGPPLVLKATVGASFGVNLQGSGDLMLAADGTGRIEVTVRNTGNAPDSFRLEAGNLPNGWSMRFPTGASHLVSDIEPNVSVAVPVDVSAGEVTSTTPIELQVKAVSLADPSRTDTHSFLVSRPAESGTETTGPSKGSRGSPGPGMPVLVAAIAAVAFLARRETKGR